MTSILLTELARGLAFGAHAGQLDKSGRPYIEHPARVAAYAAGWEEEVLAWLHDVVEDTEVSLLTLSQAGFPAEIVAQVDALTHRSHEPREEYYSRILRWRAATRVKLLDVADNSSESRLVQLDSATQDRLRLKYRKARRILTGDGGVA